MIELLELEKSFDNIKAVNRVSLNVSDGEVFGLLGTNGAGKSTLLRILSGVIKPDAGIVLVDNRPVYDNPDVKKNIFYISDDQYFLPNSTPEEMADYYEGIYDNLNNSIKLLDGILQSKKLDLDSIKIVKQILSLMVEDMKEFTEM